MIGLVLNRVQLYALRSEGDLRSIFSTLGIALIVRLAMQLYNSLFQRFDWFYSSQAMEAAIARAFIDKLIYLNWEHIETPEVEKRINRTLNRAAQYIGALADLHISFFAILVTLITTITIADIPSWMFVLILLRTIPGVAITAFNAVLRHKADDESQDLWYKRGATFDYFRQFPTLLEIKSSQGQSTLLQNFNELTIAIRGLFMKKEKKVTLPFLAVVLYGNIVDAGIYAYYLTQVLFKGMLFGTFQYTFGIITQIISNLYMLLVRITSSVEYYNYVAYAYELLSMVNKRPEGTVQLSTDFLKIEFDHVWFRYPGAKQYALKDVNFTIEDNTRIAIVGENGAGKSTFLKLINRIYVPTKGRILVNGVPIQDYTTDSYNQNIAVVTQDFARYQSLTIAQNIAIFGRGSKANPHEIKKAATLAHADEFISKLPNQYNSFLTKRIEGGTELSTGQWQRIAVARQFYANRPLVILDEPTSAIDPIAEAKIFSNLYEHVKDKTVIVVSHRYNTVRAAKKILVFNNGQIIEQGSHAELIKKKGYYARAFAVQQEKKKL